jgi:hypothetical protein
MMITTSRASITVPTPTVRDMVGTCNAQLGFPVQPALRGALHYGRTAAPLSAIAPAIFEAAFDNSGQARPRLRSAVCAQPRLAAPYGDSACALAVRAHACAAEPQRGMWERAAAQSSLQTPG